MWTLHKQPQHCGAQLHARGPSTGSGPRQPDGALDTATRDRAAQQHDRAGDQTLQPGGYPASPIEHRDQDNTPTAPDARADWDQVVQPEPRQPLPEGK
ncbi:MAG TPA: hypothetical protein VI168_01995 [Croceibacterium sp.]